MTSRGKRNKYRIAAALIIAAAVIGSAPEGPCLITDRIVAVVNGEVITKRELTWALMPIYEKYSREYTGKRLDGKMAEAEEKIIEQMIDDKLILSEAKARNIEVTDEEIEERLSAVKNRFDTEEQFRAAMADQGITLSEIRDKFRDEAMKSKLVRAQMGWKVGITPSEIRKYYDSHIDEFSGPAKVRALNILIKKSEKRDSNRALFLIERIKELLDKGRDFGELAREYSQGPNAKKGGDLGIVEKGQMLEAIDGALFLLGLGEVSGAVESPLGFHLLKVIEKMPPKVARFELVKSEIEDRIYKKKIDKQLKKWLKELRKNAYISIR